jgi:hypothetical protein
MDAARFLGGTDKRMISLASRMVLKTAAVATTGPAAPFGREGPVAGKLSIGLWDRWVPGADDTTIKPR